jgi:hypothetical protein
MREYAIAGGLIALLLHSEVFTLALLLLGAGWCVFKLFDAAAKEGR